MIGFNFDSIFLQYGLIGFLLAYLIYWLTGQYTKKMCELKESIDKLTNKIDKLINLIEKRI